MPKIFISHATANDIQAEALRSHLIGHHVADAQDIFVDHTVDGIRADEKWQDALASANAASVALICLVSPEWLASRWGQIEVKVADQRQRADRFRKVSIITALIGGVTRADMRTRGFAEEQIIDLREENALTLIKDVQVGNTRRDEAFATVSLTKLRRALEEVGVRAESFPWQPRNPQEPTPYPGLAAFNENEAGVFVGREASIAEVLTDLDALRINEPSRLVTILAASGVGKSSFLRAGLWPRLKRRPGFTPLAIVKPGSGVITDRGDGLIATATRWFRDNDQSVDAGMVQGWLGATVTREGLVRLLEATRKLAPANHTFVLGVDQAEELFNQTDGKRREEAVNFLTAVFDLLSNPEPGLDLMIVATIRADSWDPLGLAVQSARDRAQKAGAPNALALDETVVTLPPLSETAYRDVITEPIEIAHRWAAQTGKILPGRFEPGLVEHLLAEFKGADALPLLAMALDQLFATHTAQNEISRSHYDALYAGYGDGSGPVAYALTEALRRAETTGTDAKLKRLIVPQLATWDRGAGAAKRIVASEQAILDGDGADLKPLLDALVETRLLTRGRETIEVAHEALLRQPPVSVWIEADKDALRARDEVLQEAEDWQRAAAQPPEPPAWRTTLDGAAAAKARRLKLGTGDPVSELLLRRGERLLSAIELANTPAYGKPMEAGYAYLAACFKVDKDLDERQRRIIGRAFVKPALAALESGLSEHALRLAAAGALLADDVAFDLVPELWPPFTRAVSTLRKDHKLEGHNIGITAAAFNPFGDRLVTGSFDCTARIWDVETGADILVLRGHNSAIRAASFSPDGKQVLTASGHDYSDSADNTARIWDAATGAELTILRGNLCPITTASFSPDGKLIITGGDKGEIRLWDTESGLEISNLVGHLGSIQSASFSPDGKLLVTSDVPNYAQTFESSARLWDTATGSQLAVLKGHTKGVRVAIFSPDGTRVLTGSDDATARLWDAKTGREVITLNGHADSVRAASFSPDGTRLLTGSDDATARLWDTVTGSEIAVLRGHTGWVLTTSFTRDGKHALTAGDTTARLWEADTGTQISVLRGHKDVVRVASISPDGFRVVTASWDATAIVHQVFRVDPGSAEPSLVLTAALARGIGTRTADEAQDLLMQGAPDDLFAEALTKTGLRPDDPELLATINLLHAPMYQNRYFSQSADKFAFEAQMSNLHTAFEVVDIDCVSIPASTDAARLPQTEVGQAPNSPNLRRPRIRNHDQRPKLVKDLATNTPLHALISAHDNRLQSYEDANHDAMKAQSHYKGWGRVALVLMTFATIVSASMLFPLERLWPQSAAYRGFVSGLQSAANAIALGVVWWLSSSGAVGRWMTSRAEAERLRGDYFRALLLAPAPDGVDPKRLWREKLELFEAAHLDYQRKYFEGAEKKHRRGASGRSWPSIIATTATVLGIAVGAVAFLVGLKVKLPDALWWLGLVLEDPVRWQLGFNTAASALLAYASARAMITQDERNAALYAVTMQRLDGLRTPEKRSHVQAAADRGDGDTVLAYAREAQAILDADHQAWLLNRPPTNPIAPPPEKFKV